jgi:hypothetical protein
VKYNFKETWKETLFGAGSLSAFVWGCFNHFVSVLLSLFLVFFAAYKLIKKLKIL